MLRFTAAACYSAVVIAPEKLQGQSCHVWCSLLEWGSYNLYFTIQGFYRGAVCVYPSARSIPPIIQMATQQENGAFVAVIADEDTVTGFLLAGIGNVDIRKRTNFLVVDSKTTLKQIEQSFKEFTARDDIAIVLISQYVANMIRHVVAAYRKTIPAVLEIPSKDCPYDPNQDSVMARAQMFLGST